MLESLNSKSPNPQSKTQTVPVFAQKALDRCHITFPDCSQPTSAILFENRYYAYVMFYASSEKAQQVSQRLISKGREVIVTRVRKGFVLWVYEPDAQPAK